MAKIFVSYNRKAESVVKNLAADIEALGHTAWFDHELSGGQAWWDQILATIRDCSIFVFVLSPEGLNSTACQREYSYAAALGKPVLPVLVTDGVSVNLLPPALSKIEFVDYRQQDREAAFRLARALITIPAAADLPHPLPPPPEAPISYLGGLTEQVDTTATLSYPEQTALLADLRRSLRDSENTQDARTLLQKLRRRRDLLATIADDIDELLGLVRKEDSSLPDPPSKSAARAIRDSVDNPYLQSKKRPPDSLPRSISEVVADTIAENPELKTGAFGTTREKAWAAIEGAIMGYVLGIMLHLLLGYIPQFAILRALGFALSGAIAGAITATRVERVVAIAAGVSLAFVAIRLVYSERDTAILIGFSFPPLCALATRFFARRAR